MIITPHAHAQHGVKQSCCLSDLGPKNIENSNNQLNCVALLMWDGI